jgi:HAD superfamily hydrolase (TIGR01509 family)
VWQGALGGFLIAGVLRVVVVQHSTFFINSLCHTIGKRPYSTKHSARDSIVMAFATFGEGYHNYHHEFQHDYRNGVKPWQWDPTKWTIWTLSKLGLASNSVRNTIDLMMRKSALDGYLDAIVSNQDVKHGKPDPAIYVKAMSLLGVQPAETLVLEDNEHGIAAARAAGCHLMIIKEVTDVTLDGILGRIREIEEAAR